MATIARTTTRIIPGIKKMAIEQGKLQGIRTFSTYNRSNHFDVIKSTGNNEKTSRQIEHLYNIQKNNPQNLIEGKFNKRQQTEDMVLKAQVQAKKITEAQAKELAEAEAKELAKAEAQAKELAEAEALTKKIAEAQVKELADAEAQKQELETKNEAQLKAQDEGIEIYKANTKAEIDIAEAKTKEEIKALEIQDAEAKKQTEKFVKNIENNIKKLDKKKEKLLSQKNETDKYIEQLEEQARDELINNMEQEMITGKLATEYKKNDRINERIIENEQAKENLEKLLEFQLLLTKKIKNAKIISAILSILSLTSLIYLDYKNKLGSNIDNYDMNLSSISKEPKIMNPDLQITPEQKKTLKDNFFSLLKKVKGLGKELYNSLVYGFNTLLKISNISYIFAKNMIDDLSKIKDIKSLKSALYNFNIFCYNMIISSGNYTKVLIDTYTPIIYNYSLLMGNKAGQLANENLNLFISLIKLPNVNKVELIKTMNKYISYLPFEFMYSKLNDLNIYLNTKYSNIFSKKSSNPELQKINDNAIDAKKSANSDDCEQTAKNFETTVKKMLANDISKETNKDLNQKQEKSNMNYDKLMNILVNTHDINGQKLVRTLNKLADRNLYDIRNTAYHNIASDYEKYKNNKSKMKNQIKYYLSVLESI